MQWNAKQWRRSINRFKAFMIPLVAFLGRRERRAAATSYVQGLLMPGQRKSIAIAYLFILTIYLASKKSSGLSWEKILEAIRPWLLRSNGSCPICRATFPDQIDDST